MNSAENPEDDWEWEEFDSPLQEYMPAVKIETKGVIKEEKETEQEKAAKLNLKKRTYYCNESASKLREAVVVVLGHVDAGKTTLLDCLRNSDVQSGEAGGITQQIGATHIPIEHILKTTEELNKRHNFDLKLPGLVCIDTPGHESFSNMRVRGSSLCDIAILVVDIKHGLQTQTIESVKLLKRGKTRFVVALNKVDNLHGWRAFPKRSFKESLENQTPQTLDHFKKLLGKVKAQLLSHGIIAVPYWKCKDLDVQVPIIPVSAIDACGIPDLMMFTMLYSQCVLTKRLLKQEKVECAVLEVQEAQGLGNTIDVLLINGTLNVGDQVMLCTSGGPVTTSIRSLILAPSMMELKGKGEKKMLESQVKSATAVRGVKIWAKGIDNVLAGSNLYVLGPKDDPKVLHRLTMQQFDTLKKKITLSSGGVHVQASTLGSLEALMEFLNESGVAIGSYNIGQVNVKDVKRAHTGNYRHNQLGNILLAFDVHVTRQAIAYAHEIKVDIIQSSIIYQLVEQFREKKKKFLSTLRNSAVQSPCILAIAPAYIIHEYNPLIIGITVMLGNVSIGSRLYLEDGLAIGEVESLKEVTSNSAVVSGREGYIYIAQITPSTGTGSTRQMIYGRDFFDDDRFYTKITLRQMNELEDHIRDNELDHLKKLAAKYRAFNGFPEREDNN
eukprot:TRINITY_DN3279_c0_g1_i3.p1 TRINITY_DN3279_c0_g1~~TRINITY_DN3279_c0_g1_i3.p1  ORF type:complete len:668 (+),score=208.51 TRINITY_DN3279_c0_g1_i3:87-2090(+)